MKPVNLRPVPVPIQKDIGESMVIAIASGKGGTGKTTVAANLAVSRPRVTLLDCDVEEPNVSLFLTAEGDAPEEFRVLVPVVDDGRCDGCGACARFCEFKALAVLDKRVLVFNELCHSCGGCALVCPQKAIREEPRRIGVLQRSTVGGVVLWEGRLDVGEAMAPPLINALKRQIPPEHQGIFILDAPPGTSCPVVATLRAADYVVLVTEPTPFGLNDLRLAVDLTRLLNRPFGVVINRHEPGVSLIHTYCAQEQIPILAEIPYDRRVAEAYARGELMVQALPDTLSQFEALWQKIEEAGRA